MTEVVATEVAVGDQVRVHFHPPGSMRSFCEGVVSRVDVTTREGRYFVVEVKHEVILDQEHRIRPGFQDFVRYECQSDFPGRIEILSTAEQAEMANDDPSRDTEVRLVEGSDEIARELDAEHEQHLVQLERHVEPQEVRRPRSLIAALFGRQK